MYEIKITDFGKAVLAESALNAKAVNFETFSISSEFNDEKLQAVCYKALINSVETHSNEIWVNCIIPEEAGGFWIRYLAILDNHGNVIAGGDVPEVFKASKDQSPTVNDYTIKLQYENADQITIQFNSEACATVSNYYQLAESIICLMNHHTALAWHCAKDVIEKNQIKEDKKCQQ